MRANGSRVGLHVVGHGGPVPHRHAVDRPQLLSDGEYVQQRLRRVLPHAVSSVDHRLAAMTRRALRDTAVTMKTLRTKRNLRNVNFLNYNIKYIFVRWTSM